MSYQGHLTDEINRVLDELATDGDPWRAAWIAHEICDSHERGLVSDSAADFWRHCGYRDCRSQVTRCINRRAGDGAEKLDEQLKLPGYEHLQGYYVVDRAGEEVGIALFGLTDDELEEKVSVLRRMGAACFAHADEIDRYLRGRLSGGSAVA